MSFLRRLKHLWYMLQKARELRRNGIDPAEFFRRRGMEKALEDAHRIEADVPEEARAVWEDYEPDESAEAGAVTAAHLTLIRRARFAWNAVEAGAPRLDPAKPYGSADPLRDIAEALGEAPVAELARRHAGMTEILNLFVQQARIEPGTYDIEGRAFLLSPEHLVLAREMTFSWDSSPLEWLDDGPWPTPACDPKRPYGRFTFHQKEMAIHLGWLTGPDRPLTDEETPRLTDLHHEMLDVLRVMAAHATPGADASPERS